MGIRPQNNYLPVLADFPLRNVTRRIFLNPMGLAHYHAHMSPPPPGTFCFYLATFCCQSSETRHRSCTVKCWPPVEGISVYLDSAILACVSPQFMAKAHAQRAGAFQEMLHLTSKHKLQRQCVRKAMHPSRVGLHCVHCVVSTSSLSPVNSAFLRLY